MEYFLTHAWDYMNFMATCCPQEPNALSARVRGGSSSLEALFIVSNFKWLSAETFKSCPSFHCTIMVTALRNP